MLETTITLCYMYISKKYYMCRVTYDAIVPMTPTSGHRVYQVVVLKRLHYAMSILRTLPDCARPGYWDVLDKCNAQWCGATQRRQTKSC